MRQDPTSPGGFFVGLGGIVAFCVMSSIIFLWVKSAGTSTELRPQQAALGLIPKPEDTDPKAMDKVKGDTKRLLTAAAESYNDGRQPNLDNLPELRGVVRYRAAQNSHATAADALNAPSSVAGKTVIQAAMEAVASEIKAKSVAKSSIALMEIAPADPNAVPLLPNYTGGGAKTQLFADPNAKPPEPAPAPAAQPAPAPKPAAAPSVQPAPVPAPAAPPPGTPPHPGAAPAPGAKPPTPPSAAPNPAPGPGTPVPQPVPPAAAPAPATPAPAPARPPLINPSEPQK